MSVRVLSGIIKGIRRSQDRSMKIGAARDKKRRDDEEFELKKKMYQLKIDEARARSGSDPMLEMLETQIKDQFKARDAQSQVEDNMIGNADRKQSEVTKNLQRTGSKVAGTIMKQRRQQLDWSYNTGSRAFTIRPSKEGRAKTTVPATEKVLGTLQSGRKVGLMGAIDELNTRIKAERYARNNLGIDWKENFPRAVEIIDSKFGKSEYQLGQKVDVTGKGTWEYLGENKWKKVR